jgi:hypothetical protein
MNFDKRILKTGALAVAVTVAFAIFAYRAAEWNAGIHSDIVVLGQGTGTDHCDAGTAGAGSVQNVKVIPQMALGSFDGGLTKYSTVIQIVNTSGAVQSVSANFYKRDGASLDVPLNVGASMITNGVLPATSIAKDGMLIISGGGTTSPSAIGWAKIIACGGVSISTFFELRDGRNNVLYSRVGVAASPANMSSFIIPRVREVATGLDVSFAIVNTGTTTATLKVELKDSRGDTIAAKDIVMAAGSHQSTFTNQLFAPLNDPRGRTYQYLKFSSTSSTWAAIALAFEGPTQASFPVDVLQ